MVKILEIIITLAKKYNTEIYLTGGAVRDILLDKEVNDFDFAVKNNVKEISIEFSEFISGSYIELDKENDIYRVVKNNIDYDFTALQGGSIEKDLLKRDFTINALAIPHQHFDKIKTISNKNEKISKKILIDPFGGIRDLNNSLIRVLGRETFDNDPIRLLRAVRFKAILDFDIEKNTEKMIFKKRKLLKNSAAERIRDELFKIFEITKTAEIVNYMENKLKLLSIIFPEIKKMKESDGSYFAEKNLWAHNIDMLNLYKKITKEKTLNYLPEEKNIVLMKFAILFHEYGKMNFPKKNYEGTKIIEEIFENLKFSNYEINYIKIIIEYYRKVFFLYDDNNLSDSKIYDFFEEVEDYAPDILFLAALDYGSMKKINNNYKKAIKFWEFINELLRKYRSMIKTINNPILTGKELMNILDIGEGPLVGKYLKKVKKYQALGKIDKKSDAISYLKNLEINKDNNN
ncbi:MAG: hypothetical protein ACQEQD_02815 [Bacillota bacterium]